jgi:hypothetical protein
MTRNIRSLEAVVNKALNIGLILAGGIAALAFLIHRREEKLRALVPLGGRPSAEVALDGEREPVELANLAHGECLYVVFYWSGCPACRALSLEWREGMRTQGPEILPSGWAAAWVAREADPLEEFLLPGSPVISAKPLRDNVFTHQMGITAFPYFAVLDRGGAIATRGVGGRLLEKSQYLSDCSIDVPRA